MDLYINSSFLSIENEFIQDEKQWLCVMTGQHNKQLIGTYLDRKKGKKVANARSTKPTVNIQAALQYVLGTEDNRIYRSPIVFTESRVMFSLVQASHRLRTYCEILSHLYHVKRSATAPVEDQSPRGIFL